MLALGKIAIDSPEVQLVIRRRLSSDSPVDRAVAVRALENSKRNAPQLLTEFIEILKSDSQPDVRMHAATAIAALSVDRQLAIAGLTTALDDSDPNVRGASAAGLGSMGPAAKSALSALRRTLLEARCGIPGPPTQLPPGTVRSFVLARGNQQVPQPPLVQTLMKALHEIDVEE